MSETLSSENPFYRAMEAVKKAATKDLMTCLPGHVVAYDSTSKPPVAQVQIGIQRLLGDDYVDAPIIINVPVQFAGTAKWSVFHELPAGTEGMIHFSRQAIDTWIDQGGIAIPSDERRFSAEDAFFSPGYRSAKTAIAGLPTDGIGMTNAAGTVSIHLTDSGITLTAGGASLTVTADGVTHNGKTTLNDRTEITSGGLAVGDIEFDDHVHDGVETGSGTSGGPQ